MSDPVAEDVVSLLEVLPELEGIELSIGQMTATPDELIVVRTQGGRAPDLTLDGVVFERQSVSLMFRSTDYEDAMARARAAWGNLFLYNLVIGGNRYLMIEPLNNPADVGTDASKRRLVSFTVDLRKEN